VASPASPNWLLLGTRSPLHGVSAATRAWIVPQLPVTSAASTVMAVASPTSSGIEMVPPV